jgi:hypothetical protein
MVPGKAVGHLDASFIRSRLEKLLVFRVVKIQKDLNLLWSQFNDIPGQVIYNRRDRKGALVETSR